MPGKRPVTIAEYIDRAPAAGQPHLRRLYALLKDVAPEAQEAIKWGHPFFIEPRFLFAFSAHRTHLSFTPMESGLAPFRKELAKYDTTKVLLRIPYSEPLPAALILRIARRRVRDVGKRGDEAFW